MATVYCRLGTGVSGYVVYKGSDVYDVNGNKTISNVSSGTKLIIYAKDVELSSGYALPADVYTSTDGSSWSYVDYLQSTSVTITVGSSNMYIRVGPATVSSSYSTNLIHFRTGQGVSSYKMQYASTQSTGNVVTVTGRNSSTSAFVRDGTDAALINAVYESGYGAPFQFVEYTDSSFATIKKTFAEGDAYVRSNGTRYIKLYATYIPPTTYYQIEAHGNGGTFPDGSTYWLSAVFPSSGDGGYVIYDLGNIPTPTRSGYTLKGWASTATSTTVYGDTIGFTASSTSASSPTVKEVYAVWQLTSVTITLDGNGGKWDAATGRLTITKNVGDMLSFATYSSLTRTGYTLLGWSASKSATTATYGTNGYVTVGATDATYYAVWQKNVIALFYWSSASADATLIAKGKPVSNLTSVRWNSLMAKIKEVAEAEGGTFSYGSVSSGGTFYATEFNEARTGILNLTGYGTLPAAQSAGGQVKAALFEGSGSLKTALNAAIDHYNNS